MLSDFKNIFNFSLSRIVLTPGWSQTMQFYCDMVWIEKRGWTYASVWHTSVFVKTTTIIAPINKLACCLYAEHDVSVSGFNLRCFAVRSVASQSIQCYITFQSYPMHLTFSVRLPFRRCLLSLLLRSPYDSLQKKSPVAEWHCKPELEIRNTACFTKKMVASKSKNTSGQRVKTKIQTNKQKARRCDTNSQKETYKRLEERSASDLFGTLCF